MGLFVRVKSVDGWIVRHVRQGPRSCHTLGQQATAVLDWTRHGQGGRWTRNTIGGKAGSIDSDRTCLQRQLARVGNGDLEREKDKEKEEEKKAQAWVSTMVNDMRAQDPFRKGPRSKRWVQTERERWRKKHIDRIKETDIDRDRLKETDIETDSRQSERGRETNSQTQTNTDRQTQKIEMTLEAYLALGLARRRAKSLNLLDNIHGAVVSDLAKHNVAA